MNIRPAKVIFVLGKAGTPFVGYLPTKGVPDWCGLALQANLLHVMLEGKLNMESILILLLKRRPAYSLKKLIFGGAGSSCRQTRTIFQVFIRPWCVLRTTNTANRCNFHIGLRKGLQSVTNWF